MSVIPAGEPWGDVEKAEWLAKQAVQRSYANDVLLRLENLDPKLFSTESYGRLSFNPKKYPLYIAKAKHWNDNNPTILITGGVHGYETSGVKGALQFLEQEAQRYTKKFNIIAAPCISPWSYETINRWNPYTENPNREFLIGGKSEEARLLMEYFNKTGIQIDAHIDLHETTDTDKTVYRAEQKAKDGKPYDPSKEIIPDGFYLVGTIDAPNYELERAVIESVRKVTHIAQKDKKGNIIGEPVRHEGVIDYPGDIGLCANFTGAHNRLGALTTEIYPDSKGMTDTVCNNGQVAAVTGMLDHLILKMAA